jgi:diguanylate cyclase (GGDEF)-like protein
MISIRSELTELERSHQLQEAVLDCYIAAIRNVERYALELDSAATTQFQQHLSTLANDLATERWGVLDDSRATLRALLRDYRDRGSFYIANLRDELAGTARALEEILDSLNQSDGDHEAHLRTALLKLRSAAATAPAGLIGPIVAEAADSIEQSVEQLKKVHQLNISQFQAEIRVLHQRIDRLERAASVDQLTALFNRSEMVERIKLSVPGQFNLLLIDVRGLLRAEVQFGRDVSQELAAAFARRLRNCIADDAAAARWSAEEFVAMVKAKKSDVLSLGKWIADNLSGTYACLKSGKVVRPSVQVSVAMVETFPNETTERVLQRIDNFLVRA